MSKYPSDCLQCRFRRGRKLLPVAVDKPQQVLFLGLIPRWCQVMGLNKSDSSFSTAIDLEELDLVTYSCNGIRWSNTLPSCRFKPFGGREKLSTVACFVFSSTRSSKRASGAKCSEKYHKWRRNALTDASQPSLISGTGFLWRRVVR